MSVQLARLGDFCFMKTGKLNSNAAVEGGEYPFFTCAQETLRIDEYAFETEAVLLGGNNANGVFPLKYYRGRFNAYQRTYVIEPKSPDNLLTRYLYYALRPALSYFESVSIGAATQYLTKGILNNFKLQFYDVDTQARIVDILSAYDDLIENNRRRIALLEHAVRELHREWFVRLRFPGYQHTKPVDGLPDGWIRRRMSDVCGTVGGGTPSTKVDSYWDGDVTWVVPTDVTRNDSLVLLDSTRKITERGLRESSAKLVPAETILMTSRASVGFFALMDHEVCTNQGFINVIPNSDQFRMYLLFNLMSRVAEIRSNSKGTTYPEISKGRFRNLDIVVPTENLVIEFSNFACDLVRQMRYLKLLTHRLSQARDLLLPRLLSGELAVRQLQ